MTYTQYRGTHCDEWMAVSFDGLDPIYGGWKKQDSAEEKKKGHTKDNQKYSEEARKQED